MALITRGEYTIYDVLDGNSVYKITPFYKKTNSTTPPGYPNSVRNWIQKSSFLNTNLWSPSNQLPGWETSLYDMPNAVYGKAMVVKRKSSVGGNISGPYTSQFISDKVSNGTLNNLKQHTYSIYIKSNITKRMRIGNERHGLKEITATPTWQKVVITNNTPRTSQYIADIFYHVDSGFQPGFEFHIYDPMFVDGSNSVETLSPEDMGWSETPINTTEYEK